MSCISSTLNSPPFASTSRFSMSDAIFSLITSSTCPALLIASIILLLSKATVLPSLLTTLMTIITSICQNLIVSIEFCIEVIMVCIDEYRDFSEVIIFHGFNVFLRKHFLNDFKQKLLFNKKYTMTAKIYIPICR